MIERLKETRPNLQSLSSCVAFILQQASRESRNRPEDCLSYAMMREAPVRKGSGSASEFVQHS